jgi:regulator of sigma E protease
MLIYILATVFVLGVLILIHELGHFMVAKAVDIRVPRFSIGLGPKLIGFKKGETEYCLSAIPFGGYVKMAGETSGEFIEGGEEGDAEAPVAPSPRDFDQKPIWARLLVVSAGSIMNYFWGFLVLFFLVLYQGIPYIPVSELGVVEWGEEGPMEELSKLKEGDRIIGVSGIEFSSWNEAVTVIMDESRPLSLKWADTEGDVHEASFENADLAMREKLVMVLEPAIPAKVGNIQKDSPAEAAGFEVGDIIVSIQGIQIDDFADAVRVISMNPEKELEVVVMRGESEVPLRVTPESQPEAVDGESFRQVGKIGIERDLPRRNLGLLEAFTEGVRETYYISAFVLITLEKLVIREISPRMLGGPVMIAELAGNMARWGFTHLMRFMALFSVNLAILNILPIPILDGGHVVFLLIEKLKGKPLSEKVRIRLSQVGLILLLLTMAFVTWNDGLRLFGIY